MSRCFPFPPPGYEKKASADDVDFLKKEKQKEKKHKKEKKEKEKGENEEKKEDRSDGKHKDKKDKKEKNKDKKKEKDRDKEKDKSNNSEKKFPAHPEVQNGENTADEKKLPGKSKGHSWEKHIPKEKGRDKDRSSFSSEKKLGGQFSGYNGEKVSQNSHLAEEFEDAKFVQELGRRVRDEGAGAGNRSVEKFMGTEPKRDEGMVGLVAKTATAFIEEKEKNERSDDMKLDVPGIRNERRPGGNGMVQNIAGAVNARLEVVPIRVESNTERRDEWKEKTKEKGSDGKTRDKRKDKDREKEGHGKDKDRDKEEKKRRKEEKAKAKAKAEHRNLESDNLKGSNKDVPVGTNNLKASDSSKEGNEGGVVEENFRKRKDCRKNGFFHVNNVKPNKLLKTTSSLLTDNGRTLEPCQAPIPLASNSHRAETDLMVDAKEHKLNGTNEAQLSYISSPTKQLSSTVSPTKHILASAQASQVDVVSTRTPHPDSKYLSQVLSVPGMEEWLDFDDQSWLFHSNEYQSKKPKVGFSHIDEAQQVWAEALQLGSADVCALPYVIPY
ncbi:Electron transport complex protein rnfC, putative isoform 3 [Hibiscus syriacus]|uniref:Electron transport complex protein rnfC, putative isoform 3 n=1 Tax=Hibiscus syriacus TaxID=106335 RepID=A0A6A3CT81_HIBSY|nr:glutamic acid-rich protein-like [Hibiscus syriacus]KAE8732463.1 Electron transport complex protein rnfC, putative isoform 3 [Hibiscus syriacus]